MGIDVFSAIRDWAPKELLAFLDQVVYFLPREARLNLRQVISSLPPTPDNMARIMELVRGQWSDLRSQDSLRVVVAGFAGTGRAALVQALEDQQEDTEAVTFALADTHGLDEYLGYRPEGELVAELAAADIVLLVLDAQYELSESTVGICKSLSELPGKTLVVLNKIDLAEAPREAVRLATRRLRAAVFPMVVSEEEKIEDLLKGMVAARPRALYPLCRAFPAFRRTMCASIVQQASFAAAVSGALPIPFSTFLPVAAIHTAMLLKLARAFGHRLDAGRVREILPVLALDLLVDQGLDYVGKRAPRGRALLAASASGLYTYALGQAAIRYFQRMLNALMQRARVLPGPGNNRFSCDKR
jgi:uncharacterized protein (DUF697 family)